ncbi:ATP-dependent zinc metalloprotease FtsH [Gemelliphila palaticanis]|uniref:ATP-dependent zinc metalloprotease FtsH n=1 Tax=Gemelliphila palaticanis TaxID=81950 RepID=A0ABX2SYG7_9BACL|nr:ATP-dependent zinc metalloprotease FtsH [Gemella palaticanis]MBF0715388.1 ATP-dependent zinc metalloprotease FtsH [Gemella palaticanis]NYS47318.1 ATP-dependent metallopeptidase FtsH/Yme1/Tma family protein [Gemella palaticanis]
MNNNRKNSTLTILAMILVSLGIFAYFQKDFNTSVENLTYTEFVKKYDKQELEEIVIQESEQGTINSVTGKIKNSNKNFKATISSNDKKLWDEFNEKAKNGQVNIKEFKAAEKTNQILSFLGSFLPFIIMIGLLFFFMNQMQGGGGGKVMNFQKSKARKIEGDEAKVTFDDVAGCDEEKQELAEMVEFLKDHRKFTKMGAKIPKGVLLEGPPGTGKTLLARAVAGEAKVPFFSISGSDFVEMFVGVGASRVRDLFKEAVKSAPCIIFIDEIDAVGRKRGSGVGGGNDEREQTLNQLLVEMDGFEGDKGIIVIAATNRADVLDSALRRPGRFDRQIKVSTPDVKGREAILKVHAKNKPLAKEVELRSIAEKTPGFSGADLANLLNEAALLAARENKKEIDKADLDEAMDRVIGGPAKRSRVYTEKEKRLVAYHEAGHAIVGMVLDSADKVQKVTIIPRGDAGGYNLMIPEEEKYFMTKTDLTDKICGLLGGRAAEQIFFNEVSTGAHNDFERVTAIARAMVTEYGMSDKIGPMQFPYNDPYTGRQLSSIGNYSEEILRDIDSEVRRIVTENYSKVLHLIETHREKLELIAQTLMKVETIDRKEIVSLYEFGKMPNELDEETAEKLDKIVNKKYYEELAKEKAKKEAEKSKEQEELAEEVQEESTEVEVSEDKSEVVSEDESVEENKETKEEDNKKAEL